MSNYTKLQIGERTNSVLMLAHYCRFLHNIKYSSNASLNDILESAKILSQDLDGEKVEIDGVDALQIISQLIVRANAELRVAKGLDEDDIEHCANAIASAQKLREILISSNNLKASDFGIKLRALNLPATLSLAGAALKAGGVVAEVNLDKCRKLRDNLIKSKDELSGVDIPEPIKSNIQASLMRIITILDAYAYAGPQEIADLAKVVTADFFLVTPKIKAEDMGFVRGVVHQMIGIASQFRDGVATLKAIEYTSEIIDKFLT